MDGETWIVDGEAVEMTMAMIPFDSLSQQSAGTEISGPRTRVRDGGGVRWRFLEKWLSPERF